MRTARSTWRILTKDLRIQVRRRSIVVMGFVAPLALAAVLSIVLGGAEDDPNAPVTFDVGVAAVHGDIAQGFLGLLDDLDAAGLLDLATYDDGDAARAAVDDGEVRAAWIVEGAAEIVVVGDVDAPNTVSFAEAVADRFATGALTSTLAATVAIDLGVATPDEAGAVAERAAEQAPPVTLAPTAAEAERLDLTTTVVANMALFFVFFTAGVPVIGLIEERSGGTLARLLAAPIPAGSILAGKALAAVALGTLSLVSLLLASTLLLGAEWGPLGGAALLSVAAVVAATGIMSAAGAGARTPDQAGNLQGIVAVVLAVFGGAFVPIGASSGALRVATRFTPHGWYLDGLGEQLDGGVGDALPAVGVLLAMGLVTGAIGVARARKVLRG